MELPTKARVSGIDYLAEERKNAQFDVQAMKVIWAGSERELQISQKMAALVASDPVFKKDDRPRKDRVELYKDSLKKAAHGWRRILDLKLSEEEAIKFRAFVDEPNYMDLHWGMFIPAMKGQATEEQQKYWLQRAYKVSIIGCYAQTELGHGSNVQGLETTATFDVATDEFVINSPTLTSSKWWPGGLGKASTHALVYARLITDNKDYGVHAFVVPIRSLEDHKPLPGITVGDIGVKFGNAGYNTMDNGLLRFNHIRIPRDYMLMRLAKVTRQGKYIASDVPKQIGYGAMVYVRQGIVYDSSVYLSRAVTIAVRYSCIRRQFGARNGEPEVQVINYKTQQHRLFPLLATAYAYRFLGQWMKWLYSDVMARLAKSDFSTLPEVHACTAGLKSVTTSAASDAIEECRKLCGGHGYLCSSGLPELYAAYVPACTYEGDNIVLLLQVARFLMKTLNRLKSGDKPVGTASYLARISELLAQNSKVSKGEDWLTGKALVEAFEARSARMNFNCASKLAQANDMEAGFEEFAVDLVDAARAHCELIVVSKFFERTQLEYSGRGISQQLQILSRVYALSLIESHAGDFLSTGYITPEQATLAKDKLCELYAQVRPNAVALVDAFDHTDHYLGSILGRYDGEVYPHLYNDAWNEPLNKAIVTEGYEAYLKPVLRQDLQGPSSRL